MNDLISRQDAIDVLNVGTELLRRVLNDADIVGVERAKYEWGLGLIESYISDMKELPSVRQWIPVTERLPEEDGGLYLVTDYAKSINRRRMHLSRCYMNKEGFWSDVPIGYKVVAWMPLPEPYSGADMRGNDE